MLTRPNIPNHLLWEYDISKFNFEHSYKIVIERVLERGNMDQWKEIYNFYGPEKIAEVIEWSAQLDESDKSFSRLFLKSDFFHAA